MINRIRPGGPFLKASVLSGEAWVPPRMSPEPVIWRTRGHAAMDLLPNVAILSLLAAQALIVTRTPLVVNAPTKKWAQVEQTVNRAVYRRGPAPALVEPTFYPRSEQQLDVAPNLAVLATQAVATRLAI